MSYTLSECNYMLYDNYISTKLRKKLKGDWRFLSGTQDPDPQENLCSRKEALYRVISACCLVLLFYHCLQ